MVIREITIIGLGGIGSVLSNTVSRFINSKNIGVITINLVDGDDYEEKNLERQEFTSYGNKASVKKNELEYKFRKINYVDYPIFIDERSAAEIIKENCIVFLAVDNHKTRKLVSDFVKNFKNVVLISGGNELTDGNVQIYIRKDGVDITPSLTDYHPEIENPKDKSPDEMSCEELSKSEPQLYFTNFMVANYMCAAFYNIIEKSNYNYSEVYFDLLTMNANSKVRKTKNQNKKEKGDF